MYRKNIVWRIVTNINCNKCNFCIVGSPAISTKTAIFFLNFFFSFQRIKNIFREIKYYLSYKVSPWAYNIRFWGYLCSKVAYAFKTDKFINICNFYNFWSYTTNTGSCTKNCIFDQFVLKGIKYTLEPTIQNKIALLPKRTTCEIMYIIFLSLYIVESF